MLVVESNTSLKWQAAISRLVHKQRAVTIVSCLLSSGRQYGILLTSLNTQEDEGRGGLNVPVPCAQTGRRAGGRHCSHSDPRPPASGLGLKSQTLVSSQEIKINSIYCEIHFLGTISITL